jgi:hypothetical protein
MEVEVLVSQEKDHHHQQQQQQDQGKKPAVTKLAMDPNEASWDDF